MDLGGIPSVQTIQHLWPDTNWVITVPYNVRGYLLKMRFLYSESYLAFRQAFTGQINLTNLYWRAQGWNCSNVPYLFTAYSTTKETYGYSVTCSRSSSVFSNVSKELFRRGLECLQWLRVVLRATGSIDCITREKIFFGQKRGYMRRAVYWLKRVVYRLI